MYRKYKRVISWCLVTLMILTQIHLIGFAVTRVSVQKRLSGDDRYKTAAAISQSGWKTAQYAVLARGDDYADALCAGPLAQKYGVPILLTETEELNRDTLAELKRLDVKKVFIIGGYGAVSSKIESTLTAEGIEYDRIYGADRYETSEKIAERLGAPDKIVLATGLNFPDALSISAAASKLGMPILLTEKDNLPEEVKQYINGRQIAKTYVIGGTGVISDTVLSFVPGAVRLGGNDRFETNTIVMDNFKKGLNFSNIYVAIGDGPSGDEFADALSGAVLAARTSSPVVLTNKVLPGITENYLKSNMVLGAKVIALGGEAAVPQSVVDSIAALEDEGEVEAVFDKSGTYGPRKGTETIHGNVVISAEDVILRNTIIEGDLLLEESVGSVTLSGVTVMGTTFVRGSGTNSIIMDDFSGKTVTVDGQNGCSVSMTAKGSTEIGSVTMDSDGKLEESFLAGAGFEAVKIPEGADVTLSGNFDTVDIEGAGTNLNVENRGIDTLNLREGAYNTHVDLAGAASITTLTASAPASVAGTGAITTANIKSDGVSIAQKPITTNVIADIIIVTGEGGSDSVVNGETLQMNAAVIPANADDRTIDWEVAPLEGGTAAIDSNGLLTATGVGTVRVTAANKASGVIGTRNIRVKAAEAALVSQFAEAESAEAVETLLGQNELGLTLTDYDRLDEAGRIEVAAALYDASDKLTTKALIQAAVTSEIAEVKTVSDKRTAEAPFANVKPTYLKGILLVNKKYHYPSNYNFGLLKVTADAFNLMKADAAAAGYPNLYISSGFRSYSTQGSLFKSYSARDGEAQANLYSAYPGQSEHQTGLAIDISGVGSNWEWVHSNAHKYGFILRYPKGKTDITGYQYEPWHFRYVGVKNATDIYNSGLTLEEYLGGM